MLNFANIRLTKWSREFGGIFSLKRFTNTTLIISDRKLIKDLLDKKSNIYSNRPASIVARLITQGDHILIMDYGETWRKIRKLVHQYFMESMCEKQHIHVQHAEATQMMRDFMIDPDNHMLHPKRYSNSITNSLGACLLPECASDLFHFGARLFLRLSVRRANPGTVVVTNHL